MHNQRAGVLAVTVLLVLLILLADRCLVAHDAILSEAVPRAILINAVAVAGSAAYPTVLTYDSPESGVCFVTFAVVLPSSGNAFLSTACYPPGHQDDAVPRIDITDEAEAAAFNRRKAWRVMHAPRPE